MATQQHFSFLDDEVAEAVCATAPKAAISQPTVTQPTVTQPTVTQPTVTQPRVTQPTVTQTRASEASASEASASEEQPSQPTASPPSREVVLKQLRSKVGCISTPRKDTVSTFSTGCDVIDHWLPAGGLAPCTLTDWIAAHDSAAAGSLAMLAAADRLRQVPDRPLVIVDCDGSFYPPSAVALGVPVERMVLLRPAGRKDAIWAIDQSLRSGAVAAVWASLPMRIDDRDARRLQLAAETGHTPGLLVRDFHERGKPSFSEVQFYVTQQRRRAADCATVRSTVRSAANHPLRSRAVSRGDFETLSVTLDRVRGGIIGRQANLMIDDQAHLRVLSSNESNRHETAAKHLASQLANPTSAKRSSAGRVTAGGVAAERVAAGQRTVKRA